MQVYTAADKFWEIYYGIPQNAANIKILLDIINQDPDFVEQKYHKLVYMCAFAYCIQMYNFEVPNDAQWMDYVQSDDICAKLNAQEYKEIEGIDWNLLLVDFFHSENGVDDTFEDFMDEQLGKIEGKSIFPLDVDDGQFTLMIMCICEGGSLSQILWRISIKQGFGYEHMYAPLVDIIWDNEIDSIMSLQNPNDVYCVDLNRCNEGCCMGVNVSGECQYMPNSDSDLSVSGYDE